MRKSTWFRAGGKTLGYVIVNNISDLKTIISYSDQIKYYIVGVGSNLLVRDGSTNKIIDDVNLSVSLISGSIDSVSILQNTFVYKM